MLKGKRILICPLDWGLGHATRCIPIIREFLNQKAEILIAADKLPLELLKKEFPELTFIKLKGYEINYPKNGSMLIKMFFSIPKIILRILKEKRELKKIILNHKIDIVVSDNRYGCYSKFTKNIFITHQLMIKSPFGESLLHKIVLYFVKRYDECWIPDFEGKENLSGDLTHKFPVPKNAVFIGPLSRLKKRKINNKDIDILAIISGPEPQKSIFEKLIIDELKKMEGKIVCVCGNPEKTVESTSIKNIEFISYADSNVLEELIERAKIIVSRSGYSTIMDLYKMSKKAIFIPTPGQTEQEYLADFLMNKGLIVCNHQNDINLKLAIQKLEHTSGFYSEYDKNVLSERIQSFSLSQNIS